jgi:hypothetical protein
LFALLLYTFRLNGALLSHIRPFTLFLAVSSGGLRDLGCEVQMVKISADGKVESVFEQFGQKKSSFNPIYDEAPDIETRVQQDATAPFGPGGMFDKSGYNPDHDDPDLEGL